MRKRWRCCPAATIIDRLRAGEEDEILPDSCSLSLHVRASEPKELILYPGCGHGLDECRDQLDADLTRWIAKRVLVAVG